MAGNKSTNVGAPKRKSDEPVVCDIPEAVAAKFEVGRRYSTGSLKRLGDDFYNKLTAATGAYIKAHPKLCPRFESVTVIRHATLMKKDAVAAPIAVRPTGGRTTEPVTGGTGVRTAPPTGRTPSAAELAAIGERQPSANIPPIPWQPAGQPYPMPGAAEGGGWWICPPAEIGRTPIDGLGFPEPIQGDAGEEPYEGFGANSGGRGGKEIVVEPNGIAGAVRQSNVIIRVKNGQGAHIRGRINVSGRNLTLDGNGVTLWSSTLDVRGQNLIIKNMRIRNGGDNISTKAPTNRLVLSHISSTGSHDDGMSLSYGSKNITVQYCFLGTNTRSMFIKYDPNYISIHHNWFIKQWIRGPLVHLPYADIRCNIQEDWWAWGGPRFESGSSGNAINNVYVLNGYAPGKIDGTSYAYKNGKGKVFIAGSLARGFIPIQQRGSARAELPAPRVTTHSAPEAYRIVREKAGCMPRDEIDQAIIDLKKWYIGDERPLRLYRLQGGRPVKQTVPLPPADVKLGPKLLSRPSGQGWKNHTYTPPIPPKGSETLPGTKITTRPAQ